MTCRNNCQSNNGAQGGQGEEKKVNAEKEKNCIFCNRQKGMAPKIDSLELFSMLLMCIEGKVDALCDNIIVIFGWADTDKSLHRFEFHYFLDSLFRGILGLII